MNRWGIAYVCLCFGLAVLVPVLHGWFLFLLIAVFPLSLPGYFITYIGGTLVFGIGEWNLLSYSTFVVFWTGLAAAQWLGARAIMRARKRTRAA